MHLTVAICTRNRGASIFQTLASLAKSTYTSFDVVVIDQSSDSATTSTIAAFQAQSPYVLRYVKSSTIGLSAARNIAIQATDAPLIAFTDDDCTVDSHWLEAIVCHFTGDSSLAQICGEVRPGPHDPQTGFIPCYHIPRPLVIHSPWTKWREGGIGANLSFRTDILKTIGGFDEALGAGSRLRNCEDGDMTYRILRAGYRVLNAPDVIVTHHGFRSWSEGQKLMRWTGYGVGAAYAKHLHCRDLAVLPTLLLEAERCIDWPRLLTFRRHSGLARFAFYCWGMWAGFHQPVDCQRRLYAITAQQKYQ